MFGFVYFHTEKWWEIPALSGAAPAGQVRTEKTVRRS